MKHLPGILSFFFITLLSGCAPAAVLITTVTARTAADPRSTGRQIDDGTLALRVSHTISEAGLSPQARVTATVYQGDVLLTGEVPDDATRQAATKAVLSVAGVRHTSSRIFFNGRAEFSLWSIPSTGTCLPRLCFTRSERGIYPGPG
ncbi:BON domain-containing protein [Salmonella enterica]|nr:BON domain-containing protein [Salmonella enterica]EHI5301817.1 BON domain-containing protein [Salmonella enterica]